jgi:hypothetical protein
MTGGREEPCLTPSEIDVFLKEYDRPCPRVELEAENAPAAEVLAFACSGLLQGLAAEMFAARSSALRPEARAALLLRIHAALHHPSVAAIRKRLAEAEARARATNGRRR